MVRKTACFTICSNNYLSLAAIWIASLRQVHPEADVFLCLADEVDPSIAYPPGCEVVPARALDIPDFSAVAFRYDIMEFNTAVKPFMFLALLERGYETVLYFDPDIEIFAPLTSVLEPLASGASLVLTPHLCSPAEDDAPRTDIDIMRTGVFNLGFLGCSNQPETERILRWWARRLRHHCINDQDGGVFVDQKFMDLVPGFADHHRILRDTTLNVAYWNLGQRRLEDAPGGGWLVDGRPLTFFHFSGFDPNNLDGVTKHTPKFADRTSDALRRLLQHYTAKILVARDPKAASTPYAYGRFASGTPIPDLVRRMFREWHPAWSGDPFETYEEYLHLPYVDPRGEQPAAPVTNLMKYLHDRSPSLRSSFDLRDPGQAASLVSWYVAHGGDAGLDPRLIEPVAARERHRQGAGEALPA